MSADPIPLTEGGSARGAVFAADEWRRHGALLPACIAGVMLVAVHGCTLGVMIGPLEKEFGWSRAEISTGPLLPSLAAICVAPLVGRAIDRFGPRKIGLFGVPFFCFALGLLSTATADIVSWWLLYGLLGLASMFIFPTIWTAAIRVRFDRNRGLALAVALSGTGIASGLIPTIATLLLQAYGWRGAYIGIAALCFVTVFPLVLLLFARTPVDGVASESQQSPVDKGLLKRELASASYRKLAAATLIYAICACVITVNTVPIVMGEGFEALAAAKIAGMIGVGTIIGRLGAGLLLDRFDARLVAAGSAVLPLLGIGLLLATQSSSSATTMACLALGMAAGTEYDACAYLVSRDFSARNFGSLFGLIGGLAVFGAGIAPILANRIYDVTGSYDPVLWAMLGGFVTAAALFLMLGKVPDSATGNIG